MPNKGRNKQKGSRRNQSSSKKLQNGGSKTGGGNDQAQETKKGGSISHASHAATHAPAAGVIGSSSKVTANSKRNITINESDLTDIKRWIESLTLVSFTSALEFTPGNIPLSEKENHSKNTQQQRNRMEAREMNGRSGSYMGRFSKFQQCGSCEKGDCAECTSSQSDNNQRFSSSNEFDLLMEMAHLSRIYGIDYNEEMNECETPDCGTFDRMRHSELGWFSEGTPCWLRWVDCKEEKEPEGGRSDWDFFLEDLKRGQRRTEKDEKQVNNKSHSSNGQSDTSLREDSLAALSIGGNTHLPSELLDILSQAGVKRSTESLLDTYNDLDEIDKAFLESMEDCRVSSSGSSPDGDGSERKFYVEARHWRADDGTSLGSSCTVKQKEADISLLLWTTLLWGREEKSRETENAGHLPTFLPRCTLSVETETCKKEECKAMILEALKIASRGKFMSVAGELENDHCAPWFHPTQQWFSLPMYLSSRFEAALWHSFLNRADSSTLNGGLEKCNLVKSLENLDRDAVQRVVSYALIAGLKNHFHEKRSSLEGLTSLSGKSRFLTTNFLRDAFLWNIFISPCNSIQNSRAEIDVTGLKNLMTSSLLEWASWRSEFKLMAMERLREALAREFERSLMDSLSKETENEFVEGQTCTASGAKVKRKKKKSAKKKQRLLNNRNKLHPQQQEHISEEEEESSDEDDPLIEYILHSTTSGSSDAVESKLNTPASLPNNGRMGEALVVVSGVIDDILGNVCEIADAEGFDAEEFSDAITIRSCGDAQKVQSGDSLEVASKTLSSNKATICNLKRRDNDASLAAPSQSQHASSIRTRRDAPDTDSNSPPKQVNRRIGRRVDRPPKIEIKRSKSSGDDIELKKKSSTGSHGSNPNSFLLHPAQPQCNHQGVSSFIDGDNDPKWSSSDCLPLFPHVSKEKTSIFDGAPLCLSGALDGWNGVACPKQIESSIITDLIQKEKESSTFDREENFLASSTAASIASSRDDDDPGLDIDGNCEDTSHIVYDYTVETDGSGSLSDINKSVHFKDVKDQTSKECNRLITGISCKDSSNDAILQSNSSKAGNLGGVVSHDRIQSPVTCPISDLAANVELSPTPDAPPTPPPQLSPIIVSLADLGQLRKEAESGEFVLNPKPDSSNFVSSGSLPSSPIVNEGQRTLKPSWSREDLRSIDDRRKPPRRDRDAHQSMGHRQVDALLSYRNVVAQSFHRKSSSLASHDGRQKHQDDNHVKKSRNLRTSRTGPWTPGPDFPSLCSSVTSMPSSSREPMINKIVHLDAACARSESALEGAEDASHCNVIPRAQTDDTMTKDGATTISSVRSPPEAEQIETLKEERDSYRDICLTLGAENAKLRNLLASKTCASNYHPTSFAPETMAPYFYRNSPYDVQLAPAYNGYYPDFTQPVVAMSDAGAPNYGSSTRSEDGTDLHLSVVGISDYQASIGRRTSGGGTYAESDTSLEHNLGGTESHAFSDFRHPVHHQDSYFGPIPLHGMQSRLSKDINCFMQALKTQLKKNEHRRSWAVDQITKAVTALWPRAQIKMYGSHVTKLCLPSSDMDFVICLPAVHKNAPTVASGDLEGRNAINETNQKVLARKLKGEMWLDQKSIKVIERTAVPVIKVSTKDSRSRVVQLDLSFDAKEHHGLEALDLIQQLLEEIPMIRPLCLVLKQFLLDRGLLTAYTGGLSSYCLFLMVTRYCQEQSPTWNDCGSLLMGLLDFYGNFFDPRTTGISVRTRQYFARSYYAHHSSNYNPQHFAEPQGWNAPQQYQFPDMVRRNSLEKGHMNANKHSGSKPPRFQPLHRQYSFQGMHQAQMPQNTVTQQDQPNSFQSGKPYTFDPVWVEDPLNPGNNVGRNAFRIFQVQRAFSDAHRALVASLEWDINSTNEFGDDGEYPLLKCLLQNEDVFFSLDDQMHR